MNAPASTQKIPLWLLALITLCVTVGMHIFVPALPDVANEFHASRASMQLAVTFYIIGMALGQLVYGPVADRFGRRPTLLVGIGVYTLASFAAIYASDPDGLIILRLFQALGGSAGLVLGRAIVRDVTGTTDAARKLALMNMMTILGPALAPILGGIVVATLDWRAIFVGMAVLGLALSLLIWWMLPETGTRNANTSAASLARNYKDLLTSRTFVALSVGGGFATMSIYAFIASAPFIFEELGRPPHEVGIYLATQLAGVWFGAGIASRLLTRFPLGKIMVRANLLSLAATLVFLAAVLLDHLSVSLVVGAMFVFSLGMGIASPAALSTAMSSNPKVIGSASGLYGATQMAVGAVCSVVAALFLHPALGAAIVLCCSGVIAQICFWIALRGISKTSEK